MAFHAMPSPDAMLHGKLAHDLEARIWRADLPAPLPKI